MIVSHEFPMSKWVKAFEALMSKDSCKIIMDPQQ
jgi:threonine dehydrogenase-like Zn-dependent dehydrogenase